MKIIIKLIIAFCVALLLLCFVGCNRMDGDNSSTPQAPSASNPSETVSSDKNSIVGSDSSDKNTQTSTPQDDNAQSLPDDFVNNTDSNDGIDSSFLDGDEQNDATQENDTTQNNNSSQSTSVIEYEDNSGWSSGWN